MIIVDVHEKGGVEKYLERHADKVKQWDDFGGDYAVSGHLIERKRWREIAGRMLETDKHLYYQLDKLVNAAETLDVQPTLLIEGDLCATLEHTKLPRERVARYLRGVTTMGIHQMLSTDAETTAKILADLEEGEAPDVQRVRGSPPSRDEEPRYIVEGIQGLGPSKATKLLEEFGTVEAVVNADPDDISSIYGFGDKTAQQIYNAFRNEYNG